jgi:hypothetical protein
MKSTNTPTSLDRSIDSGWTVHIYNRQRQLLCTLNPSHGWSFAAGAVVGILLAIVGFNLSSSQMAQPLTEDITPDAAPLQLD